MPSANGVRAPATRDQADAYRFGLRRLEAALVRGDPVPMHEQIRSQRRAALAGVVLGLCVAAVLAAVVPRPDWTRQAVVIGAESGAMYVVAHGPDRLVPVANLPAARLVLAALRAGGSTDAHPAEATPVTVADSALDGAPRTPTAAVPGALAVRPGGPPVPPHWAVCDTVTPEGALSATTVLGGTAPIAAAAAGDGVLLVGPDGNTWLVTAGQRHRVDVGDGRLVAAFGLTGRVPREAAPALLTVLPEGPPLVTPVVAGRGEPAPGDLPGRIGDVLVAHPVGGRVQHYVVLAGGLQEVPALPAELLRVASGQAQATPVGAGELAGAAVVDELAVGGWPAGAPRVREAAEAPVVCRTWGAPGTGGGVWTGPAVPAGKWSPVALAQADGPGERVDAVAVGPGGAVRATPDAGPDPGGALWLVSATGVAHRVAGDATAAALGITAAEPAPEAALRLLPTGPTLDAAAADRVVDVLSR
ncbi:type VII secretion protein EccB [Pseudonocardia sp. MH-G8]|uniref:type VII secretion protein EccB n=1 Tax=Pseudonocardia sp. MH-G8 TaxID=1854588 RepID=UPI0013042A8C|nr:type VII secretion protein EccB [Pseudonocardia sp. MH-G8]